MEAKDVRFQILIINSETQNFFWWEFVVIVLKKFTCFQENYLSPKLFWIFTCKVDSIALDPDPDQNWAKVLDPDPNSMYLDPQHCLWDYITVHIFFYVTLQCYIKIVYSIPLSTITPRISKCKSTFYNSTFYLNI